jgi:ABC-2 type transport system ATP-binding protein
MSRGGPGSIVECMTEDVRQRQPAVLLDRVVKSYGRTRAVEGVALRITPGEVVALLGPNGAGKSTTLDMMLGLTPPDAGTARLFGLDPTDAVRRGRVGAMLQTGELLPHVTVGELLELVAALHDRPLGVTPALEQAGIAELRARRTHKLSGGQAQRVRYALALVTDPDLLILDEPTAGMDVAARAAFWDTMRGQARTGRTVVFATHYLEEADAHADRIVLLAGGGVVADGPVTEIASAATGRTIRATLPGADVAGLSALAGVRAVETRGDTVVLACTDSDRALRALLAAEPEARDIEVCGADLTEAFLALTGGELR